MRCHTGGWGRWLVGLLGPALLLAACSTAPGVPAPSPIPTAFADVVPAPPPTPTGYTDFVGDPPALELGVVMDAKLRVVGVAAAGGAEQAGLRPGDVLTTVDGVRVTAGEQVWQMVRDAIASQPGQVVSLGIRRSGQAQTLLVHPSPPGDAGGRSDHPLPTATPVPAGDWYF